MYIFSSLLTVISTLAYTFLCTFIGCQFISIEKEELMACLNNFPSELSILRSRTQVLILILCFISDCVMFFFTRL